MIIRKMLRDQNGSVGMMTGLMMVVLVPSVMAAVDLTNVTATKEKVQNRLDSAVIAAAQFEDLVDANDSGEMQKRGEAFLMNALRGAGIDVTNASATFTFDEQANVLNATVEFDAPSLFVGDVLMMGRVNVVSSIVPKEPVELEIALSLDVSGSMGWSLTSDTPAAVGQRRIDVLNQGVASLINVIEEKPLVEARISVVPYSSSVNLSSINAMDSGGASTAASGTVVGNTDWAVENVESTGTGELKIDSIKSGRGKGKTVKTANIGQPQTSVLPLTEAEDVASFVRKIVPAGATAGHIGAEWALYSLLPDWQDTWNHEEPPAEFDDKARKVMLIMTDGDFTITHTPGMTIEDAYAVFQDICKQARDAGIAVYAVGLRSSAKTDAELSRCTGATDKYFPVDDAAGLVTAFEKIGNEATKLRISQ